MAVNDALLAFPGILLALAAHDGARATNVGIVLALGHRLYALGDARGRARGMLSLREREFIEASRVMGNPDCYTMLRHVLPNCVAPVAGAGDFAVRLGGAGGKRAEFSGSRRAAAGADLGQHAGREPAVHGERNWLAILPGLSASR